MPHDEWAECPNCGKTAWGRTCSPKARSKVRLSFCL